MKMYNPQLFSLSFSQSSSEVENENQRRCRSSLVQPKSAPISVTSRQPVAPLGTSSTFPSSPPTIQLPTIQPRKRPAVDVHEDLSSTRKKMAESFLGLLKTNIECNVVTREEVMELLFSLDTNPL